MNDWTDLVKLYMYLVLELFSSVLWNVRDVVAMDNILVFLFVYSLFMQVILDWSYIYQHDQR